MDIIWNKKVDAEICIPMHAQVSKQLNHVGNSKRLPFYVLDFQEFSKLNQLNLLFIAEGIGTTMLPTIHSCIET